MNEHGLMGTALYFEDYASYSNQKNSSDFNITYYDVLLWILYKVDSVKDIIDNFKNINYQN